MSEEIGTGSGSREPGMDPTITLEMYNARMTEAAELRLLLDQAARLLRHSPYEPSRKVFIADWWQERDQWLKHAEGK